MNIVRQYTYTAIVITFLLIGPFSIAQQVFPGGGLGSYRLDYPGWNYAHHIYAPVGDNTGSHIHKGPNYQGPLQTHQWWTSALWNYGNQVINEGTKTITDLGHEVHSEAMYPYPMMLEAKAEGYIIRHGFADINGLNDEIEVHSAVIDARVGLQGTTAPETSVDSYGDWHAVFYQNHGGGNILRMTAAPGCPFMFFQRTGTARPTIYGLNKQIVTKSTSGNSFIFHTAPEGRNIYIGVFFPAGTGMGDDGAPYNPITGIPLGGFGAGWDYMVFNMPGGSNYFSVAVMSNISQATLDLYESKAFNFITNTVHTYNFNEAASTLTTNFNVTTTNVYGGANTGTLQGLYKHQWRYSPEASGALNTGLTYITPRGNMQVIASNTFSTVMTHYGMLPNFGLAHYYNTGQMNTYINNFMATVNVVQEPADGYAKDAMQELGTIAQISRQLGNMAAHTKALDALQSRLTDWFTANDDWAMFHYNNTFNWLAHYPNGFTSSGYFIDMHFHMGYLIYGAAILARYRPAWAAQYGGMVECMIRQINDYRKDMTAPAGNIGWFPYLRHFDPYAGHSWAGPNAADQESVSEAIMFGYGVFLWGETVNNANLRSLGALLYITESEAAKLYWYDVDQNINFNWQGGTYPQHHVTILRARGGSYATYFSADDRWKHSITILPETAGTLWMIWNQTQAQTIYNHFPAGGYPAWDDHGYHYNFIHAGFNPAAARTAWNNYAVTEQWINPTFPHVNGDIPILYQWVHTLDSVGVYDNTVQADITGFSVFKKGPCKHYMVYMPPGKGPRVVNFSDGRSFNVPNDTVIVYRVCDAPLPVEGLSLTASNITNEYVRLDWSVFSETNNNYFEVERSVDGNNWTSIQKVKSIGNHQNTIHYYAKDEHPRTGKNYYRIKQVDLDGQSAYSNIALVDFGNSIPVRIYPNPANQTLNITSDNHMVIRDLLGRTLHLKTTVEPGLTSIDLSNLSSGIYLVEIEDNETGLYRSLKFIKE